ncbi:sensor histidine kinase [Cohnella panacarvi]|uniref:sensor histidine kinase n=1 Tax=Cohnella panacarvi TaxID=400776 RepID=UPI00047D6178|nr:sensor histidine kinase [Cohnella panacarvi]
MKLGKRLCGLTVFLALVWALTGCMAADPSPKPPEAKQGVLDLTDWNWVKDGPVPLNGEWEFEWLGSGVRTESSDRLATTMQVPGIWGSTMPGDGNDLPNRGHAVYRLHIHHDPTERQLAIRVPNIMTAYELYVNGQLSASRGIAGHDAESTVPYQVPATVIYNAAGTLTELELHVSNFDHRRGGIRSSFIFGENDQIQKLSFNYEAQEMIVFGCLIMIGIYHLGLFALRRQEIANLLFALLCLFVALRMGSIGEGMFVQWIPGFNWTTAIRFEYIAFAVSGWAGYGYFYRMYPQEVNRIGYLAAGWGGVALVLFTIATPTYVFSSFLVAYQFYVLALGFSAFTSILLAGIRRREGAKLALVGVSGLLITIVNDMMFYNGFRQSIDLVPFGLLFLILMNSFIISFRFSQTYERVEQMSEELKDWNNSLELKITERTEELQRSYATVENAKSELERMEHARKQLVSNISHDLRTPITLLQGYLEALRDHVISDEEQRNATIRLMLTKVEGLNSLIQDLFEISVLQSRKVELILESLALADWRDNLQEQYGMELEQRGIRFDCSLNDPAIAFMQVSIDVQRMNRVFENLVYNATRYTPRGGSIEIAFAASVESGCVKLSVSDNGEGINPEDLPYIFDRFYKKDKYRHSRSGGSGLGLAIVKEIVELHGGTIRVFNRTPTGSTFEITLPLCHDEAKSAG